MTRRSLFWFRARPSQRRGAIVILFCVLLVMLLAFVAFAVDTGYMYTTRTQLQRSVDAGALAGAGAMIEDAQTAQTTAVEYVRGNPLGSGPIPSEDVQVELGSWDRDSALFTPNADTPNALRVAAAANDQPLFFANIFKLVGGDASTFDVSAEAVATFQPRDVVVVLDYSGSMNDDSEFRNMDSVGQSNVEANLYQIYQELGSPQIGNMQFEPQYISSDSDWSVARQLGLDDVPYPFPRGSWGEYIDYVQSDYYLRRSGYRKRYGVLTLINYWLQRRPKANETPILWEVSAQPITALKNAISVFLSYMRQVDTDDRVGLAVYTAADGTAKVEHSLTDNYELIEDISRRRQAAHYHTQTNIGAGLKAAREELDANGRPGALKIIVLMTDGLANLPQHNARGYVIEQAHICADRRYKVATVSLGAGADKDLMQQVADITDGLHFNIPGGQSVEEYEAQLKEVFGEIAKNRRLTLVQ